MSTIQIPAHFDGKNIQLDAPYDLPVNTRLIVSVPISDELAAERKEWFYAAGLAFELGYGPDEPDYSDLVPKP